MKKIILQACIAFLPAILLTTIQVENKVEAQNHDTTNIILAQAEIETDYSTGTVITHSVRSGDTLNKIALQYGVSSNEIRLWNHLTSDMIYVGEQLKIIPYTVSPPPSGTIHLVRSGDTLWYIANRYRVTVNQLKRWNNLTTDFLYIGQRIAVTGPSTPTPPSNGFTYSVKAGDTLYSIANRYGVTVNQLKQWNNLTSDFLSIGMSLSVRDSTIQPPVLGTVYIVKARDTLWNIAYRYNITVNQLKGWNNLTSDMLYIGQRLRVTP